MRIVLTFLTVISCAASIGRSADPPKQNILLIFVDDLGYYDVGCYGATEVKTPRIDRLAENGVRFTDYYAAAPICSPSRSGLLTGRYPRRFGMATWVQRADSRRGIPRRELMISELLHANGYATACIGKWHVGFTPELLPRQRGFDYYFGLLHNLDPVETIYFDDVGGVPLLRNEQVVKRPADPAELTRLYTNEAIDFIGKHVDQPWFVYLPHTMLHHPVGVSAEFKGRSSWGDYGDAIAELDFHTGRLLDALERLKLTDRTLVVFFSDNGRGPGRNPQQPMRGTKLTSYECGLRVPCIAAGPGVRRGYTSHALVHAMDWFPTVATAAQVRVPADRVLDGRDLTSLLSGKTDTIPDPQTDDALNAAVPLRRPWNPPLEWAPLVSRNEYLNAFFYHGAEGQLAAVRSGKWKLVLTPSLRLFDLEADPGESKPVRNANAMRKLRGMAIMFQEELSANGE